MEINYLNDLPIRNKLANLFYIQVFKFICYSLQLGEAALLWALTEKV